MDGLIDADMDGYDSYTYGAGNGTVDCDDGNAAVSPDAEEVFMMRQMIIVILPMIMMPMVMAILRWVLVSEESKVVMMKKYDQSRSN